MSATRVCIGGPANGRVIWRADHGNARYLGVPVWCDGGGFGRATYEAQGDVWVYLPTEEERVQRFLWRDCR